MAPSGMPTRADLDTPNDKFSSEPRYSPNLEESAIIVPSGMLTRDHSDTPSDATSLESSYSTSLEESVTPSVVLSHRPSVASSDVPTEKQIVITSE